MVQLSHEVILLGIGTLILLAAWLPLVLKRLPVSLPPREPKACHKSMGLLTLPYLAALKK